MESNYIVITEGGWGTWPENIGCICKVKEWMGSRAIIFTDRLIKQDNQKYHNINPRGFRLAEPHEIPNQEPNYEIY